MGLDWNPGPMPKPRREAQFEQLWRELHFDSCEDREAKLDIFKEISIQAYTNLGAPRAGYDEAANVYLHEQYPNRSDKSLSEEQFLESMKGYYVLDLVPPCDGLPKYSNFAMGYCDVYSFRAEFLKDCRGIIGDELFESAYVSKLSGDTL